MKRMSVAEAADTLGVTRDAIRKRVKRGSIEWEVDQNGETFVYLDAPERNGDASATVGDEPGHNGDTSADASGQALVESLQDQVEYLRREVEVWQEESRRKDHLLARALERIPPQLEPPETPQAPESPTEGPQGTDTPQTSGGPHAPPEAPQDRRSWWRRWFGA